MIIRIQIIVVFLFFLIIFVFILVEKELGVKDDLAFELVITILKYELEDLVVVIEYLVENLYLEPGFQNLEDFGMLYLHGIVAELHRVEAANTFKNQIW